MASPKNMFARFVPSSPCTKTWMLVPLACLLIGCGAKPGAGAAAPAAPPPPEVGVVTVTPGPIGLTVDLPGRLEASRVAEVRARVAGILEKRLFDEGSDVKAGQ